MKRFRVQFRLSTFLIAVVLISALIGLAASGYRQQLEYRQAWYDLAKLQMGSTISTDVKFHSRRAKWDVEEADELARVLTTLRRPRFFGLESGVVVHEIDFRGSRISDESLKRVRYAAPEAVVLK